MIPLRVFRSRNLSGASATIVLMVAGMFGMFFLGVLYLQRILGFDAIETGLAFLPVSTLIGVMSLGVSARLNLRFGPRATLLPGLVLVAVALAYFSRAPVDGDYVTDVLPVVVLLGAGAGLVFPALTTISMSGVLPHDAGLASGVVNTSMQVGGAFGLAVLATLASDRTETLRSHGDSVARRRPAATNSRSSSPPGSSAPRSCSPRSCCGRIPRCESRRAHRRASRSSKAPNRRR